MLLFLVHEKDMSHKLRELSSTRRVVLRLENTFTSRLLKENDRRGDSWVYTPTGRKTFVIIVNCVTRLNVPSQDV